MQCFLNRKFRLFAYLYAHAVDRIGADLLSAILTIALRFEERDVKNMKSLGNLIYKYHKVAKYLMYWKKT